MKLLKFDILKFFFGNPEDKTLEDQIPLVLSFSTATLSLVATTLNIILDLSILMIFIPLAASIAMYFVYFGLRTSSNGYWYKVLMAIVAFTYFNALWYNNQGSNGPNLYLFLIFFIFILMIFEKKTRLFFSSFLLLNILALFLLEYNKDGIVSKYADDETRQIDIYFSLYIYLAFTSIMAVVLRYYYRLERNRASKSDKLKSAFLSNMSHEIRTPMNAIIGFSKLLDYAETEDERKEFVKIINDNGKLLLELLDDILDMSKMDAGQYDIVKNQFSLKVLFNELGKVTQLYLDQLNKKDVKLIFAGEQTDCIVFSDENRIRQILYNFLTNSSKFTSLGSITYGYKVDNLNVTFFVSDTGLGIEKKYFNEIFKRFYKVENNEYTSLPRGSGIGLSIVNSLVQKLGGQISFESEYGKGSEFKFALPEIVVETLTLPQAEKIKNGSIVSMFGKVLVVEDDTSNMLLINNMLRRLGISLVLAANGSEACTMINEHAGIDIILMDINMPIMNGYDAMKTIKQNNAHIPIIALTAHAMNSEKNKALNEGFDGYLTKPIDYLALVECLKKYLEWKLVPQK